MAVSDVDSRILRCVDRILNELGPDVRRALMFHMRRKHKLRRYEIPSNPDKFLTVLREVFGESSDRIEREIVALLEEEFKCELKRVGRFPATVKALRSR